MSINSTKRVKRLIYISSLRNTNKIKYKIIIYLLFFNWSDFIFESLVKAENWSICTVQIQAMMNTLQKK